MAYWIHESGNRNNSMWRYFMCDHVDEINDLPTTNREGVSQPNDTICKNKCAPGSQCLCLEDGSVWVLGKDTDKWIKIDNDSFFESIKPISLSSIQSLF